ncbi:unnamed protein product [Closterium sp. Yama58-4]|nr:unnamed protein product [Closterium sp. Yama58-4]
MASHFPCPCFFPPTHHFSVSLFVQVVPASIVTSLLEACRGGAFEAVQSVVTAAVADGYPAAQILSQSAITTTVSGGYPAAQSSPQVTQHRVTTIIFSKVQPAVTASVTDG